MKIKITYVGTLNGVSGVWCGFKPDGVIVREERQVLYPEDGFDLEKDGERFSAVWLKDGDVSENYSEVEAQRDEPAQDREVAKNGQD